MGTKKTLLVYTAQFTQSCFTSSASNLCPSQEKCRKAAAPLYLFLNPGAQCSTPRVQQSFSSRYPSHRTYLLWEMCGNLTHRRGKEICEAKPISPCQTPQRQSTASVVQEGLTRQMKEQGNCPNSSGLPSTALDAVWTSQFLPVCFFFCLTGEPQHLPLYPPRLPRARRLGTFPSCFKTVDSAAGSQGDLWELSA